MPVWGCVGHVDDADPPLRAASRAFGWGGVRRRARRRQSALLTNQTLVGDSLWRGVAHHISGPLHENACVVMLMGLSQHRVDVGPHFCLFLCDRSRACVPPPPPPLVQATVNDQKLMEPAPSVAWTRALRMRRNLRDTRVYISPAARALMVFVIGKDMKCVGSLHGSPTRGHPLRRGGRGMPQCRAPRCRVSPCGPLQEWGFDGPVMSDWGGTYSTVAAANGGLDLEMPGPPVHFGGKLLQALSAHDVAEAAVDDKVLRLLRLMARTGALDAEGGLRPEQVPLAG